MDKKILALALTLLALPSFAQAACSYRRVCSIGGECHYQYVCDNNVPNPGHRCGYVQVCDQTGCHYVYRCN